MFSGDSNTYSSGKSSSSSSSNNNNNNTNMDYKSAINDAIAKLKTKTKSVHVVKTGEEVKGNITIRILNST